MNAIPTSLQSDLRRRNICLAIAAAALFGAAESPSANAVFLNPHGLGEALVLPYYTVNGGNSTLITLVNTKPEGKAVKVRVLEGYDGRDVLDFNLYLSPYDVWVGQLLLVGHGAGLFTNDNSCTVPKLPTSAATALVFSTQNFDGTSAQGEDGGPTDSSRTLEGYIEVVEMGRVVNTSKNTLDAITHSAGVPLNCGQLVDAWSTSGYWQADPTTDIAPPDGGLTGDETIVNVPLGTVEAYVADAIAQFYSPGITSVHTAPTALTPNLSSATSLTSLTYPNDTPVSASFNTGIDAVSSVFMADAIFNEYITSQSIAASSEWVVTYPTKRFYTDPYFIGVNAKPPFDLAFGANSNVPQGGGSCSPIADSFFDREEFMPAVLNIDPAPPVGFQLCFATQVETFNQLLTSLSPPNGYPSGGTSKILASNLTGNIPTGIDSGWASYDLYGQSTDKHVLIDSSGGHVFRGQPVTGFWVTQFINGNVGGALANYTALYAHRKHVSCTTSSSVSISCS